MKGNHTNGRALKTLVLIPLYNHADTVAEVVKKAISTGYPVLVVDDGSTDNGLISLKNLDCQTIILPENRGKGAAILAGARYAAENGFEALVTLDADGQHNPLEAEALIAEAEQGTWPAVIIGAREMTQETVPGSSHFGKNFSNFWVRLECGRSLPDTQSGMRLYPVKELLLLDLKRTRYDFEIELLVKAVWAGVDARSVSVSVHYPPADERISHFNKLIDNWRLTLLHTSLICRRLMPLPYKQVIAKEKHTEKPLVVKNPWQTLKNICKESSSPFWLAVAVWFGVFLGALPLIACHTIAIIYVAYRFQLNKVAAVAASQFCMPPLVPALCIEVGYYLRNGEFLLDLSWDRWLLEIPQRLWDWFLGSLIVGPVLGLAFATLVYWFSRRFSIRTARKLSDNGLLPKLFAIFKK